MQLIGNMGHNVRLLDSGLKNAFFLADVIINLFKPAYMHNSNQEQFEVHYL